MQQHAVGQRELLAVHPLDFLVQDGLERLRRDRRGSSVVFQAGTRHPQNPPDKGGQAGTDAGTIQTLKESLRRRRNLRT
jgi:hypothetical protein